MTVEEPIIANGEAAAGAVIVSDKPKEAAIINEGDGHFKEEQLATQTEAVGVIAPAPDIRSIVDKTAQFVARNGPEFEKRILANEKDNVKFQFLQPTSPFHAYYQLKIKTFKEGDAGKDVVTVQSTTAAAAQAAAASLASVAKPVAAAAKAVLTEPPAFQYMVSVPEGLALLEVDLIKLTAQFVARNGKDFLSGLMSRELANPQFGFLKPTHSLFPFFTSMADAYSKVLMPPKGTQDKLRADATDLPSILQRSLHRLEWDRTQQKVKQEAADKAEAERTSMAMIDWHDFVVAETIEFLEEEEAGLPEPMAPQALIAAAKREFFQADEEDEQAEEQTVAQQAMDDEDAALLQEAAALDQDEEEDEDMDEDMDTDAPPEEEQEPEEEAAMKIVRNYKRAEAGAGVPEAVKYVISPITGEKIPVDQMAEHMRISLIDPKYKEQKEAMMAKLRDSTMAQDDEIGRNIMLLANKRPDIFASTAEEVSLAVQKEIDASKLAPEPTPPGPPPLLNSSGTSGLKPLGQATGSASNARSLEEQIAAIHKAKETGALGGAVGNLPTVMPTKPTPSQPPVLRPPPPNPLPPPMIPPPMIRPNPLPPPPMNRMPMPGMNAPAMGFPPPGQPSQPQGQFQNFPKPMMTPAHVPMPSQMAAPAPPMTQVNTAPQSQAPPPPPTRMQPPPQEEPEAKRAKMDENVLMGAEEFAAKHVGAQKITVSVPEVAGTEMHGQHVTVDIGSVMETVLDVKNKLAQLVGLAANKQKLVSVNGGFMKDNDTLAFYNIANGSTLSLQTKERGGRKK